MAENNPRSYRDRWRDAEEQPRAQANDPLAELARLIGQSVPMKTDRRPVAPEPARHDEFDQGRYAASEDEVLHAPGDAPGDEPVPAASAYGRHEPDFHSDFAAGDGAEAERYESAARANPLPPLRTSRFRRDPDFASTREHNAADEAHDGAYQEDADWRDQSADAGDDRYTDEYADEYENEPHDGDAGYDDEHEEDFHTGRRGGFVFVAAVFVLAVLGTAGAFGYRAMFGTPAMPALPPIIKAEGGPTKIIPSDAKSQDTAAHQADATNAGSGERLVSREERPVDIPPPVTSTAPRPVSTVPVFPDPPAMGGPGAVVGYSASAASTSAASSSPATSPEPPAPTAPPAPAMTTGTASSSSANQAFPPPSAPPAAVATAPASGPRKIRTVTIHTDQSGAADATASSPSARPGAQSAQAGNQGSNAPLSLVPATSEAPAAPARPRPAPTQPVPLNKPPANQTASAAPVAPAATGGGYAVQVSSQRSEAEAQSSFRDLQAKYPDVLGGRSPIIRRADLGAKGIYFRAMVGPFTSADQATELCSNLKAAGGSCLVQKN